MRSVVGLALACAALTCAAGCRGRSTPTAAPAASSAPSSPAPTLAAPSAVATRPTPTSPRYPAQAVTSRVARLPIYASPGGRRVRSMSNPQPYGMPLTFLLERRTGSWLRVWLPVRPNGSRGWVRSADVRLSGLPYRLDVHPAAHTLRLYRFGSLARSFPIAVGKSSTPTPGGTYYLTSLLRPSNPRGDYGPYAYGLSGFSTVLKSFNGGNGIIGLHGTNDPASIGQDVSHGCLRMRNADIVYLTTRLALGTPVQILRS